MNPDFFDRQRMIGGWEQDRLTRARVAVVGGDWLAGYCALYLACLGVGRIYLLDCARAQQEERFFFPIVAGEPRVKAWADWLSGIGFSNRIIARHTSLVYDDQAMLPPVDFVIKATDSIESREALVRQPRPVISAQTTTCALKAAIVAALVVEETRRHLLPLQPEPATLPYHHLPERFAADSPTSTTLPSKIMMVGAGALGNFVALGLAACNDLCSLIIIDPDYIDASNLNRQPLFLRNLGNGKAITLAKRLRQIHPEALIDYSSEPVSPRHFDLFRPDLVLSCVDSFAPRQLIHRECLRRGIPLINGGTNAFTGHLEIFQPGRTACFNCLYGLDDLAEREASKLAEPTRCRHTAEASIVTTNALIAAMMAAEASNLNDPLRGIIRYDGRCPTPWRLGYDHPLCNCYPESAN